MYRIVGLKGMTARAAAVVLGVALMVASSGCGLFGSDRHAGFVETMLGQLPDTKGNRAQIYMSDDALRGKLDHFVRPADLTAKRYYFDLFYIQQWNSPSDSSAPHFAYGSIPIPPFDKSELPIPLFTSVDAFPVLPFDSHSCSGDARRELGFDEFDVDQELFAGSVPHSVEILRGEHIDAGDIDRAVHADPIWKSSLQARTHGGERSYRWTKGAAATKGDHKRTSVTCMGQSRGMAADGHQVRLAGTYDDVEASIDTGHGKVRSLADDDTLRSMAQVLDDHHAYNAFLSTDPGRFTVRRFFGPGGGSDQTRRGLALARKQALRPWRALAIGDAVQDAQRVGVVVIANADPETARANASQLRRVLEQGRPLLTGQPRVPASGRYRDMFKIESITTRGPLVVAVVSAGGWFESGLIRMTMQGEPLLAHD